MKGDVHHLNMGKFITWRKVMAMYLKSIIWF